MVRVLRGATTLRNHVQNFLVQEIPPVIDVMREEYALSEWELPYPAHYDCVDPTLVANGEYPLLGAVVINDNTWNRVDWDTHAQQVYSPVFTLRFYVVARTPQDAEGEWESPGKQAAIRLRDDLIGALHHVILQTPSFGQPDSIRANESNMTTDYLEPVSTNTQGDRWIAEALINVSVAFSESTYCPPIGTANTATVTAQKLVP